MILIYGKGKVGKGLAEFCDHIGAEYEVCDDWDAPESFDDYEYIIPSPGIPPTHSIYESNHVVCELDFLEEHIPDGFLKICVTGTDGKSTTCHMIHHLLAGLYPEEPVYLTGNNDESLGSTMTKILQNGEEGGVLVIEVSSFMCYVMREFVSDITVLTNLHPDHLDWHPDLDNYYESKMKLLMMTAQSLIVPDKLFDIYPEFSTLAENIRSFNGEVDDDMVLLPNIQIGDKILSMDDTNFSGFYMASNLLSACLVLDEMGLQFESYLPLISMIEPLPHRIELVAEIDGRKWIEDSKSTTSQSQMAALDAMPDEKTVLIAGGKDKGDTFAGILQPWRKKCAYIIFIGETADMLAKKAESVGISHKIADSLEQAVQIAKDVSEEGDSILLSPGCSSFDMFENYLDRAEKFRAIVVA